MALLFSAATDRVEVADSATIRNLTAGTYLAWAYVTSTANSRFCQKGTAGAVNYRYFGVVSAALEARVFRPTSITTAQSALTNFASWGTSKWCFFAATHDTAGANGDQKLFVGDLTTLAAEPSSYSLQTVGSGTVGDNTTHIQYLSNGGTGTGPTLPGSVAVLQIYNRVLTIAEIQSLQFRPRALSGCVGYWIFGGTTGTQADYSGNANAGTVTGATVADHVPLPAAFSYDLWVEIARAATSASTNGRAGLRSLIAGASSRSTGVLGQAGVRAQCVGVKGVVVAEPGRAGVRAQAAGTASASVVGTFAARAGVRGQVVGVATRTASVVSSAGIRGQCVVSKAIVAADLGRAGTRAQAIGGVSLVVTGTAVGRVGLRAACVGSKAHTPGAVGSTGTRSFAVATRTTSNGLLGRVGLHATSVSLMGITSTAVGMAGAFSQNTRLVTGHGEVEWSVRLERSRWQFGPPVQ